MNFHSTKKTQKKKKIPGKKQGSGLTPAVLERRVKQLMSAQGPEKNIKLASESKGTLEQIGHEADQAWSGVKRIMALLNVEMKHVYFNSANNSVTQVGTLLDLTSLISQGVGGSQRIGDSLKIKRVRVKMTYSHNPTMTSVGTATFVLGMSRDGVPGTADVFAVVSNSTSGHAFPLDTYDKADFWKQSRLVNVDAYNPQKIFEFDHDFNHDVLYANAGTTVTSGCVWLAFISNEATNFPQLQIAVDVAFLDN